MMNNHLVTERPHPVTDLPVLALHLFEATPGNSALIQADAPRFTILAVTDGYLHTSGATREVLIGKGLFEAFTSNSDDPNDTGEAMMRASFEQAITQKALHQLPVQRYDMANKDGSFSKRYWQASNKPVLTADGTVTCIIHTADDITDWVKAEQSEDKIKGLEQAHSLFMQAPISIHMIKGLDLIIEMANAPTLQYWGRGTEVVGLPLMEALPELEGQGYDVFLREVLRTGETKEFYETPVTLQRNGKKEVGYFNFIYKPYYEEGSDKPVGIVTVSTEVTDKVLAKKELAESAQSLELAVEIGELGIFNIELSPVDLLSSTAAYSRQIAEWFGFTQPYRPLSEVLSRVHPDDQPVIAETLERSVSREWNGRHDLTYRVWNPETGALLYLRSIGQVHFNGDTPTAISGIIQNVTSQVLSGKKVEESEERFRNLVMHAPVAVAMFRGSDFVAEIANDAYLPLVDKTREEFIGKPLFESLPETKETLEPMIKEVVRTGTSITNPEFETIINRHGRNETCYFNLVWEPLRENDGSVNGFMVVAHEITEQVTARKKAEESEHRFRSLIAESSVAICLNVGRELRVQYANDIMIGYWGKGRSVMGKPLREALPELEGQSFFRILDEVYTTGVPYVGIEEKADLFVDGELQTFYFNLTYKALRNKEGVIYGILQTALDVTEQVLVKKKIEESRQNLRNIILQAPVAMCILKEPEYIVEIANERMIGLWGKTAEEVLNKPLFEGLPEVKEQGFEDLLKGVYTTGETCKAFERPVDLPRNGKMETTYLNFVYEALYESNGVISGIMVVAIDVTEQVLARLQIEDVVAKRTGELAEANQALQRNNQELEQFAYIASHDLQEPLRKVSTFTEMLTTHLGEVDDRSKNFLSKIASSTARMLQLIRDVLNFSQLSNEHQPFERVNLNELIESITTDFELIIEQKGATIRYTDLPVISAIPLQMRQLFGNLLSNALKFTKDTVPPVVTLTAQRLPEAERNEHKELLPDVGYYLIKVTDNGIGFSQEHADKIFGIFQRLHGKTEFAGTGIGLALCKKIAQNHHGDIWATSGQDCGAVFHIILPEKIK